MRAWLVRSSATLRTGLMTHARRNGLLLASLAVVMISGGCVRWRASESKPTPPLDIASTQPESPVAPPPAARPSPSLPEPTAYADERAAPPYCFRLKPQPGVALYYTIENEIRDLYAFPPLLSVTASVKDRRFITQQVASLPVDRAANSSRAGGYTVTWTCERYEVRERGLKDEVSFDSVRDLYPPPTLWLLGGVPGSVCTFELDPATGACSRIVPRPAQMAGSSGSAKLSRTAENCALTVDNLQRLLDDLGPLYLPDSPKDVGEQWNRTLREEHKSIGTVVTTVTCSLRSVRELSGRSVATIDIASDVVLHSAPESASKPAGSRTTPGTATKPSSGTRPYQLDKGNLSGAVEFDLTRGELLSLKLHRETEFFAELEASAGNTMVKEIRTGSSQDLRVTSSRTPPPMPLIVGGKKPPTVPPGSEVKPPTTSRPTSRPAGSAPASTAAQQAPLPYRPNGVASLPMSPATQAVSSQKGPRTRPPTSSPAGAPRRSAARSQPGGAGRPTTPVEQAPARPAAEQERSGSQTSSKPVRE